MTDTPTAEPVSTTAEGPHDDIDMADAPGTNTPATNAPATNTPATNAPATTAPATNPAATNPPATNPPTTNPAAVSVMPTVVPGAVSAGGRRVQQLNEALGQGPGPEQRAALEQQRDAALAELVEQVSYRPGDGLAPVVASNAVVDRDVSGDLAVVRDSLFPNLGQINPVKLGPLDNNCHLAVQAVDRMLGGHPLQVVPKAPPIQSLGILEQQMGGTFGPPTDLRTAIQGIGSLPPGSRGVLAWSFPDPLPGHTEPRTGHLVNVVKLPGGQLVIVDGQAGDLATLPGSDENPRYQFMPTHVPGVQQAPTPAAPAPQHAGPRPFGTSGARNGPRESTPPRGYPSIESVLGLPVTAAQVQSQLAAGPKVTVFVEWAANSGHQAAATMLIDSLKHLGHTGEVTITAHPDVHAKLTDLLGADHPLVTNAKTLDFDPEKGYADVRDTGQGIGDSLLVVAASDTIDESNAGDFLNAMGADRALVLQPYAWGDPRRLLVRAGPGQPVEVKNLTDPRQGDPTSTDQPIGDATLYQFPVPPLTPDQLNTLLAEQPPALGQVLGAVSSGQLELMPAYGLHNLAPANRPGAVPTLAAGIHQAGLSKPAVLLDIRSSPVDGAPPFQPPWLTSVTLGGKDDGQDLAGTIAGLGPGDVLVVRGPGLPQDLFRHVYQQATLPAVLEGANTANLVQLLGKPYLSVLTHSTPYPHRDVPGADQLEAVSDGLGQSLNDKLEAAETTLEDLDYARPNGDGTTTLRFSEVAPAAQILGAQRFEQLLGGVPNLDQLLAQHDRKATVTIPDTVLNDLKQALSDRHADLTSSAAAARADGTLALDPHTVADVATVIRDLRNPHSTLSSYVDTVTTRAQDPNNDQLLQGLRHLLAPAANPPAPRTGPFGARSATPGPASSPWNASGTSTTPDPPAQPHDLFTPGTAAYEALRASNPAAAEAALADAKAVLAADGVSTPPDGMAEAVAGLRSAAPTPTGSTPTGSNPTSANPTGTDTAGTDTAGTGPARTGGGDWRGLVDGYYAPKLPAYATDGSALSSDAQTGPAVGGPDIAGMVRSLSGKEGWQGLDVVQRAADHDVASLTGGRAAPFTVYHDGEPYELTLTARPDPGAVTRWRPAGDSLTAKTKVTLKDSTGAESTRDHTASVPLTASMAPGMAVTVTPTFSTAPTDRNATKTTGQATHTTSTKLGDQVDGTVPVHYELSLVDKDGRAVAVTGDVVAAATAQVPMRLPRDIGTHRTLGAQLDTPDYIGISRWNHSAPRGGATIEAVTLHPRGRSNFAAQLTRVLGGRPPAVGSEGRQRIQAFAAKLGNPDEVAKMIAWDPSDGEAGWVGSDPIPGRNRLLWTGGARTLQMRLVPRWVKTDGTVSGVEHGLGTGLAFGAEASHTAGRSGGVAVSGGPALTAGAASVTAGPQVGHARAAEHTTEVKQSTAAEHTVTLPGDGTRYQIAFQVQVRTLGGGRRTLDGVVSAAMWSHPAFAPTRAGAGTGDFHPPGARQHYGPAGFENGNDAAAHLLELSGRNNLFEEVARMLRDVPTKQARLDREMFVRQFGDRALGSTLSAKISRVVERSEQLRQALSEPELRALRQTLAGPGLYIPVTYRGRLHDHTTVLLVRSRIDNISDGPAVDGADPLPTVDKAEDAVSMKHKSSRSHTTQLGATGRVSSAAHPQLPAGTAGVKAELKASRDASTSLKTKHTTGAKQGGTLTADGKLAGQRYRHFQADVHLSVDMLAYRRRNAAGRWLLPNRPGRHVPTFQRLTQRFPFGQPPHGDPAGGLPASLGTTLRGHYLVPESLVSAEPPAAPAAATTPTVTALHDPPAPQRLAGGPRDLDGARLVGFSGSAHLHAAARDLLAQASRGDPITRFPEADLVTKLQQLFSPDRIAGDPRRYSRPGLVTMSYQRGAADLTMAVGLALRPTLTTDQVSPAEWAQATHDLEATLTADAARTWKASLGGYVTGTVSGKLGTGPAGNSDATGNGLLIATAGPGGEVGGGRTALAGSGHKLTVGHEPEKVYLAKVSHVATLVAEAQHKGNLDWMELFARPAPGRAGATVAIPGTDLVWLTGRQLAALGRPDPDAPPAATDPVRRLPVPPALDPARAAGQSMGLGGLVDPVDLGGTIAEIQRELGDRLGAAADALLPPDAVSAGTDTHQSLTNLLSTVHHEGSNLLNGGVAVPVRQEFRWKGHTFLATVRATFTPDAAGGRVGHQAKLELTQSAKLSSSHASSGGRQLVNYAAGGRLGPSGVTHQDAGTTGGPHPGTGGAQAGAQLQGQLGRRSGGRTESTETTHEQSVTATGPVGRYGGRLDVTVVLQHGDDGPAARVTAGRPVTLTAVADSPLPRPRGASYGRSHPAVTLPTGTDPAAWVAGHAGTALPRTGAVFGEHFFGRIDDVVETATAALRAAGVTVNGAVRAQLRTGITASALKAGLPEMGGQPLRVPVPGGGRVLELYGVPTGRPRFGSVSAGIGLDGKTTVKDTVKVDQDSGHVTQGTAVATGTAGDGLPAGVKPHPFGTGSGTVTTQSTVYDSTARSTLSQPAERSREATRKAPPDPGRGTDPLTRTQLHDIALLTVVRDTGPSGRPSPVRAVRAQRFDDAYASRTWDTDAATATGHPTPEPLARAARDLNQAATDWLEAIRALNGTRAAAHATQRAIAADDVALSVARRALTVARARYNAAQQRAAGGNGTPDDVYDALAALLEARAAVRAAQAARAAHTAQLARDRDPAALTAAQDAARAAEETWWRARDAWYERVLAEQDLPYHHELLPPTDHHPQLLITVPTEPPAPPPANPNPALLTPPHPPGQPSPKPASEPSRR